MTPTLTSIWSTAWCRTLRRVHYPFRFGIVFSHDRCPWTYEKRNHIKVVPYVYTIGSFMYVMLCARLDICFIVGMVSRYQSNLEPED